MEIRIKTTKSFALMRAKSASGHLLEQFDLMALRKGKKPQVVVEDSLEDHFARIKDNAADFDEALELFNLLSEEMPVSRNIR